MALVRYRDGDRGPVPAAIYRRQLVVAAVTSANVYWLLIRYFSDYFLRQARVGSGHRQPQAEESPEGTRRLQGTDHFYYGIFNLSAGWTVSFFIL